MPAAKLATTVKPLGLKDRIAADLMSRAPVSIRVEATIPEAVAALTEKGITAAPVIDEAGRPIGVLSRSDLLIHDRERSEYLTPVPEAYEQEERAPREKQPREGFQIVDVDTACVGDIMTPTVFAVGPEMPAQKVIEEMLKLRVHRLFVIDDQGVLIGVVSALDILRHLIND